MAADFSGLAKRTARAGGPPTPRQFKAKEFLALVPKRGIDRLCVASVVVRERGSYSLGTLEPHIKRMSASRNRGLVMGAIEAADAAAGHACRGLAEDAAGDRAS